MEAVQNGVQNCIEQLGGAAVTVNADPNGAYRFPARSRKELIESQQQAAEVRGVDPRSQFGQLQDPARAKLGAPEVDVSQHEVHSTSGLILPPGVGVPAPATSVNGPDRQQDNDSVSGDWML